MLEHRLKVAFIIIGSTREGRRGGAVAAWAVGQAGYTRGVEIDVIDLADYDIPAQYPRSFDGGVRNYLERLARADAFVIITPEYNHGYPASLKQAIDLGADEWSAKPVGFVSYGGVAGGIRAVEQLRQVFPELHAVTVRDTVTLTNFFDDIEHDGSFRPSRDCDMAVSRMMQQLIWWGRALREARAAPMQEITE